jgi:hypothetical protein
MLSDIYFSLLSWLFQQGIRVHTSKLQYSQRASYLDKHHSMLYCRGKILFDIQYITIPSYPHIMYTPQHK